MTNFAEGSIFAGLAGLQLDFDELELGRGVILRRTYAHLMAPFLMAFEPAPPGKPHPRPWKAAHGGLGFDIAAELVVPKSVFTKVTDAMIVARMIVALMRMWASPAIRMPVVSSMSFSAAANAPDNEAHFLPFELERRHFRLEAPEGSLLTVDRLEWVAEHWVQAFELSLKHEELRLSVEALDGGQFVRNPSLALVSLWAALESLFSPGKAELRFRISALIASFLAEAGENREKLYKLITRLYDARSAAAHGQVKENSDAVLETFELLRQVLIRIVEDNHVPSKSELEMRLFGAEATD